MATTRNKTDDDTAVEPNHHTHVSHEGASHTLSDSILGVAAYRDIKCAEWPGGNCQAAYGQIYCEPSAPPNW